jgi:fructosamine-3-kinase
MQDWDRVATLLRSEGLACDADRPPRALAGGDISAAWRLATGPGDVFLKSGPPGARDMFEAERDALAELAAAAAVRVPRVLACVSTDATSVLALEWLDLTPPDAAANRSFGEQLADLHRHCRERYGWYRDNTIGATPQPNGWSDDWVDFFRRERLRHQLALAANNGYGDALRKAGSWLDAHIEQLFDGYRPRASLLHGDLWGGNWAMTDGQPIMFDPALYYGDRESDLAMTRLFGGFSPEFYRAYEKSWPLARGYEARMHLYQLYHVLNHLNLFGSAYLGHALQLFRKLRAATGSA